MFEKLIQRYQVAKEKRRNLRETTRQLDENIKTVKRLVQAYDRTITDIRKTLDQESHAATTRETLEQAWHKASDSRNDAQNVLITGLNDLQKAYNVFREQGGPERYDVKTLLDFERYAYNDNAYALKNEIGRIGQIVVNITQMNVD